MRLRRTIIAALVLALAATGGFGADDEAAAKQPEAEAGRAASAESAKAPATSAGRVVSLVADLGDRQWATRRDAEAELTAMGHGVLAVLDPLLGGAADPEVLRRLERIYRRLVPAEEYAGQSDLSGFLGVEIQQVPPEDDPRLKGRENGLLIKQVVEDSAAERAGLQIDDLIVVLDGEKLIGDFGLAHFRACVERVGEGGELRVGLYRGDELKELKAVLTPSSQRPGSDPKVREYRWTRYWRNRQREVRKARTGQKKEASAGKPGDAEQQMGEEEKKEKKEKP